VAAVAKLANRLAVTDTLAAVRLATLNYAAADVDVTSVLRGHGAKARDFSIGNAYRDVRSGCKPALLVYGKRGNGIGTAVRVGCNRSIGYKDVDVGF
jgi:hypothetical protein